MIELEARLDELRSLGLQRRTRLVSGPQGPHVLLDGKPVLLLCSNNYLGLADHPRVRQAAAEAAMRWGVGAGASRLVSGTMTIHRRLEERLAAFKRRDAALVFGSGYLANVGTVSALARPGDVVFSDELNHASIIDGCRLSRAEVFVYDHCDAEHLAWGIEKAEGRGALIVTDSVFSMDGDVAPLAEIVELAQRHGLRTVIDEAHGTGALGPGGRGALAEAGLEDEVDVIVGTLGKALGSYGAFVACDETMARYLLNAARTFIFSTALPPPAVAAALAALELVAERPERVAKLAANAAALRDALSAEGFDLGGSRTHIVPLVVGEPDRAMRICEAALQRGVFAQAIRPPTVPAMTSRLRLAVMASHREAELRDAARLLAAVARAHGLDPRAQRDAATAAPGAGAHPDQRGRGSRPSRRGATRARLRAAPALRCPPPPATSTGCSTSRPPSRSAARPDSAPALSSPETTAMPDAPATPLRGCFVTGTDTGVGKSVLSAAIAAALVAAGTSVRALKPILTGLQEPADPLWPRDHELLAAVTGVPPADVVLATYGPPVSPHLAAELAGRPIELDVIAAGIRAAAAAAPPRHRDDRRRGRRAARAARPGHRRSRPRRAPAACRWCSQPGRDWARSTTRCSPWPPRMPPGSRSEGSC